MTPRRRRRVAAALLLLLLLCGVVTAAAAAADADVLDGLPSTYRAYAEYAEEQYAAGRLDAAHTLYRQLAARAARFAAAPAAVAHIHTRLAACTAATGSRAAVPAVFAACVAALRVPDAPASPARHRALFVCHAQWCASLLARENEDGADGDTDTADAVCHEAYRLAVPEEEQQGVRDLRAEGLLLHGEWLLARGNATGAIAAIDAARALTRTPASENALLRALTLAASTTTDRSAVCARVAAAVGAAAAAAAQQQPAIADTEALLALAASRCGLDAAAEAVTRAVHAVAAETRALGCPAFRVAEPPAVSRAVTAFPLYEFSDAALVHPRGIVAHLAAPKEEKQSSACTAYVTLPPRLDSVDARARPAVLREALFPARALGGTRPRVAVAEPVLWAPTPAEEAASYADAVLDVLPRVHHVQQRFPRRRVAVLADPAHAALTGLLRALGHRDDDGTLVPHYAPDVLLCRRVHVAGAWASAEHHARAVRALAADVVARLAGTRTSTEEDDGAPRVVLLGSAAEDAAVVAAAVRAVAGAEHVDVVHDPARTAADVLVRTVARADAVVGTPGPALAAALWAPARAPLLVVSAPAPDPTAEALRQLAGTRVVYVDSLEALHTHLMTALPHAPSSSPSPSPSPAKDEL